MPIIPGQYRDSFSIGFHSLREMMEFHNTQERESHWEHVTVAQLCVEALDVGSRLWNRVFDEGNMSDFALCVSAEAVADTARSVGLALKVDGSLYPLRDTSFKGLCDRAKIGGSSLAKLNKSYLATILNQCFELYKDRALILIRDEKVSAVHSGDSKDYSILQIDKLLERAQESLENRFPGNWFESGHTDHTMTGAAWAMPNQTEELIGTYQKVLASQGKAILAGKFVPGIRFVTSDVGTASAKVSPLLVGPHRPIPIGGVVSVQHRGQSKLDDFTDSMEMMFAKFGDSVAKLESLLEVYLEHPVNVMTAICKKLSLPKKASLEASKMFEVSYGGGVATAHDVFMAMQEIMFILKTAKTSESRMLDAEESLARALALDWEAFDFAKAVAW